MPRGGLGKMGVSALTGVASGFTVKRVTMIAFSVPGIAVVSGLLLALEGWMSADWGHIEKDVTRHLAGDPCQKVVSRDGHNLPSADTL